MASDGRLKLAKVLLELRVVVTDGLLDVLVVGLNFRGDSSDNFVEAEQESPECVQRFAWSSTAPLAAAMLAACASALALSSSMPVLSSVGEKSRCPPLTLAEAT